MSDIVPTRNSSPIKVILPKTFRRFRSTRSCSSLVNRFLLSSVFALRISFLLSSRPTKSAPSFSNSFLQWASSRVRKETLFSGSVEEYTAFSDSAWHILAYIGAKKGSLSAFSKNSVITPASLCSLLMSKACICENSLSWLAGVILFNRPRTVFSTVTVVIWPAAEFLTAGLHAFDSLAWRSLSMGANLNSLRGTSVTCAPIDLMDGETFRFASETPLVATATSRTISAGILFRERRNSLL